MLSLRVDCLVQAKSMQQLSLISCTLAIFYCCQCQLGALQQYCLCCLPCRTLHVYCDVQKQKVDYMNLPSPVRYEDSQREAISKQLAAAASLDHT